MKKYLFTIILTDKTELKRIKTEKEIEAYKETLKRNKEKKIYEYYYWEIK